MMNSCVSDSSEDAQAYLECTRPHTLVGAKYYEEYRYRCEQEWHEQIVDWKEYEK